MATITIDNKEYDVDSLSDESKAQLVSLRYVDSELARLQAQAAAVAALQLFIGEPGILAAEDDGYAGIRQAGFIGQGGTEGARRDHRPRQVERTCAAADHQAAIRHGLFQRLVHRGAGDECIGTRGA